MPEPPLGGRLCSSVQPLSSCPSPRSLNEVNPLSKIFGIMLAVRICELFLQVMSSPSIEAFNMTGCLVGGASPSQSFCVIPTYTSNVNPTSPKLNS